ncbi:hypothetical protein MNBD_PLANCTO02-3352 [hydrothermal vent metagenome]|uniref:DUF304 domain-containing protein n=1 Tax=hydrothermal vent metagenome TaxID=652676 RepID=A0A3B1E6V7_9ZZZZ
MTTMIKQPIAGVTAGKKNLIHFVYPSIAAIAPGRLMGSLCNSIPLKINGIKLSVLLFGLPLGGLASLLYFAGKAIGEKYVITSQSVEKWKMLLGVQSRLLGEIELGLIDKIELEELPGQEFFHAADVVLFDVAGKEILRFEGVQRADVFAQNITEARDANVQTKLALEAIAARHA